MIQKLKRMGRNRKPLTFWRGMFYLLMAMGITAYVVRFTGGLGAVSNLSDQWPWGFWVGFDMLCGIGLTSGGFLIVAIVYVFHLERFRPIVRPALVTAFLGYVLEVFALGIDLGRPWNLWHPMIMWNPSSPLFWVSWCVMIYSTVLAVEFSGMLFERLKWPRMKKIQTMLMGPMAIVGVIVSVIHQSTLGSLYLIVPGKMHAIWYTPMLPVLFFVSALMVGLAMVIVESRLSSRAFGRQLEMPLVSELGRALVAACGVFLVLRVFDLWERDALATAFNGTYESWMFMLEFGPGLLLPMFLLHFKRVRENTRWLYACALMVVLGFIVNRLNISITGFEAANGGSYVPSFGEMAVTLMLIGMGFALFSFAVKYLNVFPEEGEGGEAGEAGGMREAGKPIEVSGNGHMRAGRPAPILRP